MAYSQNDEEQVILGLVGETIYQGRFLDIGAYDGKTFSNTLALAERNWSGVCIEPSPAAFVGLLKVHGQNPRIICACAAVTPQGGWLDFYDSGGDALSSSDPTHVARWRQGANVPFTKLMLKSISVADVFTRFGSRFDFINIDVEGCNLPLFLAMPWEFLKETKVICVEHDSQADRMVERVKEFGFSVAHTNGENLILNRSYA